MELKEYFKTHKKVALAFSGGVDSAYLLYAVKKYAFDACAYYVKSEFQPEFEYQDALRLSKELDVKMKVIELDVLSDERIAENPNNRCYYCKRHIFEAIIKEAAKDGFKEIIDGTNASDDVDDRPGMKAIGELSVLSPLRECGLTKDMVRALSKEAGLFTYDKPSYACLATRVPCGERITKEKLRRTEDAEEYLKTLGFSDFRVRSMDDIARLEIRNSDLLLLVKYREQIVTKLKESYKKVLLDMEVRSE